MLETRQVGRRDHAADVFEGEGRLRGEAMSTEVVVDGGAEEGAGDEEVERCGGRRREQMVDERRESISS